jgi:tetratricopeptide (TPR) repeat protein
MRRSKAGPERMTRLLPTLVVAAGVGGLASEAARAEVAPRAPWVRVRAPHFELLTDASAEEGRSLARELLRFRTALEALGPPSTEETPPLTLYAFKDEASFRPFLPVFRGRPQYVGGFAQVGEEGAFAALALTADGGTRQTAYHEYTHLLLARALPPAPPWLSEGLAEFFSGWRSEEGRLVVGGAQREHLRLLREEPLLPLEELLRVDYGSPLYNEGGQRSALYAQSWALVHFVLLGRGSPPAAALSALGAVARDTGDPVAAVEAMTGEAITLTEQRLREYLERAPLPEWTVERPLVEAETEVAIDVPSRAEVECRLGQLLLVRGRATDAAEYLERSLQIDPGFVPAHLSLASLRAQQLEFAKARAHVASAKSLAPRDPKTLYRYADVLVKQALHEGVLLSDRDTAAAVGALETAVRLAPWFGEAAELLVHFREDDLRATSELLAILRRAIALNPTRSQLYLTVARLHVRKGDLAAARSALRHASESRDEHTRVLAALSWLRLDDYEATTAEVRGTLTKVGCLSGGALEFVVDAGERFYRLRAPSAQGVFLYRPTGEPLELTLVCGEQATAVVARYTPDPGIATDGIHGRLLRLTFP